MYIYTHIASKPQHPKHCDILEDIKITIKNIKTTSKFKSCHSHAGSVRSLIIDLYFQRYSPGLLKLYDNLTLVWNPCGMIATQTINTKFSIGYTIGLFLKAHRARWRTSKYSSLRACTNEGVHLLTSESQNEAHAPTNR